MEEHPIDLQIHQAAQQVGGNPHAIPHSCLQILEQLGLAKSKVRICPN